MSTTLVVLLAILTAAASMGALWFLRWQEQQRLERARQVIEHTDAIGELGVIGDTLSNWLSTEAMTFLADMIDRHYQQLLSLKAKPDPRVSRATEQSEQWRNHTASPAPLPGDHQKAQELKNLLQRYNEYLKNSYKSGSTPAAIVKELLVQSKVLNVRLATTVYESRAAGATSLGNTPQAIRWYKKAKGAYQQLSPLPESLQEAASEIDRLLADLIEEQQAATVGTRLEEGAEQLAEEDESWKKKHF